MGAAQGLPASNIGMRVSFVVHSLSKACGRIMFPDDLISAQPDDTELLFGAVLVVTVTKGEWACLCP